MRRIILVDDDEEDMFLFDKAINEIDANIEVLYAVCGEDLFYLLRNSVPDLLFLDQALPDESGLDCLKKIRKIDKDGALPVIMFTNSFQEDLISECFEAKANLFIIKPNHFEKLVQTLRFVLSINWPTARYPAKESFVVP